MRVMKTAASMVTILAGAVLLTACSDTPAPVARPRLPVYASDMKGAAKQCEVSGVTPVAGQPVDATMKLGNDGGWCAIAVHQSGPKPFDVGLLAKRPAYGNVTIHTVGDETRIDYVPDPGYLGADTFGVKLLPGASVVQVQVTVAKAGS